MKPVIISRCVIKQAVLFSLIDLVTLIKINIFFIFNHYAEGIQGGPLPVQNRSPILTFHFLSLCERNTGRGFTSPKSFAEKEPYLSNCHSTTGPNRLGGPGTQFALSYALHWIDGKIVISSSTSRPLRQTKTPPVSRPDFGGIDKDIFASASAIYAKYRAAWKQSLITNEELSLIISAFIN